MACEPDELSESAKCFSCLPPPVQMQVQTYLLAQLAGASTDPNELADLAKCFSCLSPKTLLEVQVYLLCQIVNA